MRKKKLYYVSYKYKDCIGKALVSSYTKNGAIALVREHLNIPKRNIFVRKAVMDDLINIKDKRVWHFSTMLTPLDMEQVKNGRWSNDFECVRDA